MKGEDSPTLKLLERQAPFPAAAAAAQGMATEPEKGRTESDNLSLVLEESMQQVVVDAAAGAAAKEARPY